MNIVILGVGQVGTSLAELLSDKNDVTVIDIDYSKLQRLQDRLDIITIHGHASYPDILAKAGLEDADMLIAATQNDETNILACHFSHITYKVKTKIARVRNPSYIEHKELFDPELNYNSLPIDVLISPEKLMKDYILQLIKYQNSLQVIDFAEGKVRLVAIKADSSGVLVGKKIKEIKKYLPKGVSTRIAAIYRKNEVVTLEREVTIKSGDEVFFIAEQENIQIIIEELRSHNNKKYNNIIIAGGGNIGLALASELEKNYNVKIIEKYIDRSFYIAEKLQKALVVQGDVSDKRQMIEENIEEADIFISVTNKDETNIISSMMAKKLGATRVISLVNNKDYVELTQLNSIDVAISADQITTSHLLHYMRKADTVKVFTLRRGAAEALEIIVHGSENTSKVVGKQICDISWPYGVTVGVIIRDEEVIFIHKDVVIEAEDHIVLFLTDSSNLDKVTELFNPK